MAQPVSPRVKLGCAGVFVLVIVIVIIVAVASRGGNNPVWSVERYDLVSDAQQLTVAQQAGNAQHAAQIRERILNNCHTAAGLSADNSADHAAVQSLCQTLGIIVP